MTDNWKNVMSDLKDNFEKNDNENNKNELLLELKETLSKKKWSVLTNSLLNKENNKEILSDLHKELKEKIKMTDWEDISNTNIHEDKETTNNSWTSWIW